jgi:hypothetical protein
LDVPGAHVTADELLEFSSGIDAADGNPKLKIIQEPIRSTQGGAIAI